MEKALLQLRDGDFGRTEHIHTGWELVTEYPLSAELFAMSNVWRSPDGNDYLIAAKGAPEAIADLCHFDETLKQDLTANINAMACRGSPCPRCGKSVIHEAQAARTASMISTLPSSAWSDLPTRSARR